MENVVENLWPAEIGVVAELPPVAILKQQAALLGKRTKNLVVGKVSSEVSWLENREEGIVHSFEVSSPALGGYTRRLFRVSHDVDELYPVTLHPEIKRDSAAIVARTEDDFVEELRRLFASEDLLSVIRVLLAQSQ